MFRSWAIASLGLIFAGLVQADTSAPWLEDFTQLRIMLTRYYPNLLWSRDREKRGLPELVQTTTSRLRDATDANSARKALDDFVAAFGDPHFHLEWPGAESTNFRETEALGCGRRAGKSPARDFRFRLPAGFRPSKIPSPFLSGTFRVDHRRVGIVRIPTFREEDYSAECAEEWKLSHEKLADRLSNRLIREFAAILQRMKTAKIEALLVDLMGNGGGSSWEEALRTMVTARPLQCAGASSLTLDTPTVCDLGALWTERAFKPGCDLLSPPAPEVCRVSPGYLNVAALYSGPLLVLVDHATASAAEDFAARLQDNHAATIVGEPTLGAGCGYVDGGLDLRLKNSRAKVKLPNCVRYRLNGDNERTGVRPDFPLSIADHPGPAFAEYLKGLIANALPPRR